MSFNLKLLAAAAVAALAVPAAAQEAAAPAAEAQTEASTATEAEAQTEAGEATGTEAQAETQAAAAGAVVVATPADIREGVLVQDMQGGTVGTIESVDADGAVVSTGAARAKLPLNSFGKNERGLVISLTKAELEAQVAAAS